MTSVRRPTHQSARRRESKINKKKVILVSILDIYLHTFRDQRLIIMMNLGYNNTFLQGGGREGRKLEPIYLFIFLEGGSGSKRFVVTGNNVMGLESRV